MRCLLLLNLSHTFFKNVFLFREHFWDEKSEASSKTACVFKFNWTVIDNSTRAIQWGKKIFDPLLILYVSPLTKK